MYSNHNYVKNRSAQRLVRYIENEKIFLLCCDYGYFAIFVFIIFLILFYAINFFKIQALYLIKLFHINHHLYLQTKYINK